MSSMFETIMELPLFKGIGEDQLSQLLEKTSIEFLKFEDGEYISRADKRVEAIDFILSGRVRQTYSLKNHPIEVDEILGKGAMIGALNLYGMVTNYFSASVALGKVSVMRISKKQYIDILLSDGIYILNFVNFLSAAAQKAPTIMENLGEPSIRRTLETVAFSMVSRMSETVMIAGDDKDIAEFCGVTLEKFEEWKMSEMAHNRIIVNNRGVFLKSPHLLR